MAEKKIENMYNIYSKLLIYKRKKISEFFFLSSKENELAICLFYQFVAFSNKQFRFFSVSLGEL